MMEKPFFEQLDFDGRKQNMKPLQKGEYDNCGFINCNMEGTDLTGFTFTESVFENCNLSNATLKGASFRDVEFKNCKLLGLSFNDCNEFLLTFSFYGCDLSLASFSALHIKSTRFYDCNLSEVDFTGTDLAGSSFQKCNLHHAIFDQTILIKADFISAVNYSIDPSSNRIKGAKFNYPEVLGLLDKYGIVVK